jgi:hypothetical protein
VLVGDSNASQYTAPAARAANELGYDFTAAGLEGCPFVLVRVVAAGNNLTPEPCLRFDRATLAALVQLRPSLVILANRDDAEIGVSERGLAPLAGGAFSFDPREKERLWAAGLAAVLDRLGAAGIPVLLVRPIPPVPSQPAECAVIRLLLEDCSGRLSREVVGRLLRPAFKAENRALAGAKTAHAVWFEKDLCGRDACTTFGHGILLYRDTYHLTFDGAVLLTPDFKRAIASMLGAPPTARS